MKKTSVFTLLFMLIGVALQAVTPTKHWRPVQVLKFSPDSKVLASAGDDYLIQLHSVSDGSHIRTLDGHKNRVNELIFTEGGKTLYSSSFDGELRAWNVQNGKPVSIHKFEAPIRAIALSADEKLMAVSLNNGVTSLHETSPWKLVKTVSTKPRTFTALTFSPDGKTLVGGYGGRDVAIFEVKSLTIQYTIDGINKAKPFFLNPSEMVVGSQSRKVEIYDIGSLQQIASISEAERPMAYSISGDQIAFLNHKGIRSQMLDADNFLFVVDLRPAPKVISLSPNKQSIATSELGGKIQLWDIGSSDAEPLGIPSHDLASEERSFSMIPEETYMLQNLVGKYQRIWQEISDTKGAFQWTKEGLGFSAGSLV